MATIYVCDVLPRLNEAIGPRPDLPGIEYAVLFISRDEDANGNPLPNPKRKAMVESNSDGVAHPGVLDIITAPTAAQLVALMRVQFPTNQERNRFNNWWSFSYPTSEGFQPVPAGLSWYDSLTFAARQINPGIKIEDTFVRDL